MLCVIRDGEEFVWATHTDQQRDEVATLYQGGEVNGPNGDPVTIPAGTLVTVPNDFRFAYDDLGRAKDPRRFAGEGATPIGET